MNPFSNQNNIITETPTEGVSENYIEILDSKVHYFPQIEVVFQIRGVELDGDR